MILYTNESGDGDLLTRFCDTLLLQLYIVHHSPIVKLISWYGLRIYISLDRISHILRLLWLGGCVKNPLNIQSKRRRGVNAGQLVIPPIYGIDHIRVHTKTPQNWCLIKDVFNCTFISYLHNYNFLLPVSQWLNCFLKLKREREIQSAHNATRVSCFLFLRYICRVGGSIITIFNV